MGVGTRLKEITYEEYFKNTSNLNELQLAFSDYSKSLIIPSGIGIYGAMEYSEKYSDSTDINKFKYYVKTGYVHTLTLGERSYNAFKNAIDYYKKNNKWE